jgi:hypothetical protein
MSCRRADVQAFLVALRDVFATLPLDAVAARSIRDIFARIDRSVGAMGQGGGSLPACAHLPEALGRVASAGHPFDAIATSFAAMAPALPWSRRSDGPHASANIMEGHANAMVVGPGGLEARDDVWIGASLLARDTRYPDHRHPPEEVYLVLSPGEFRQGEGPWFEPGFGGTFFNSPEILHAMRSGPHPLFAIWCLNPAGTVQSHA